VNMRTQVSQWTRPYLRRYFRAQDLEMETFVAVLVRNDVLAKRCVCVGGVWWLLLLFLWSLWRL
jgi:hypothetical protein